VDDRTDDCAFGAMMSLALRQTFRKLRFQMIADTSSASSMDWKKNLSQSRKDAKKTREATGLGVSSV